MPVSSTKEGFQEQKTASCKGVKKITIYSDSASREKELNFFQYFTDTAPNEANCHHSAAAGDWDHTRPEMTTLTLHGLRVLRQREYFCIILCLLTQMYGTVTMIEGSSKRRSQLDV
jgi:hypothetical protein